MSFSVYAEKTSVEELLIEADAIKSSDFLQLEKFLIEIEAQEADLSSAQQEFYKYLQSYSLAYKGDYEQALRGFESLAKISDQVELSYRARISLANIYAITRDYSKGFKNLHELIANNHNISNDEIRQQGLIIASLIYNTYQKYDLSKEYAGKLLQESPTGRNLCFIKQLQLDSMFQLDELQSVEQELNEGVLLCEDAKENIAAALLKINIARHYLNNSDAMKALEYLEGHSSSIHDTNYPRVIAEYYILFARAKWQLGEQGDAINFASKVLDISDNDRFIKPRVMAYALLHEIKKANGDFKMALDYYEKYSEADKAQINEILAQQLAYNIVEQQTQEKVQEIKLLNKQNEVLTLQQNLAKKEAANDKLAIALLVSILGFIGFWTYRIKRNQIKLRKQAEVDQLTGVSTRHHFYESARALLQSCESSDQEVSFILFDMDSFKKINDHYGHLVGDYVLKEALSASMVCWRKNDLAGRLGGEEFAILLPACDLDKAAQIAEHCRRKISEVDTSESGHQFPISASFGVTSSKYSGYELKELIADSDRMMYVAKDEGRDRVKVINSGIY
ncbi:MAG: diguanylate cyclase [Kangiellaceae bacterium]|nr:diguanylate cyclase [Kangiellaceae bacterium]